MLLFEWMVLLSYYKHSFVCGLFFRQAEDER
jgi:hypothetical protein